jgi:mRNA interferase RelE/StbE
MYELTLTRDAQRFYEEADPPLVRRLHRCFEHLRQNPYEHPNVKRLRGSLAGYFRYRVGDWRVVYEVDEEKHLITVLLIAHRSKVYR